MEMHIIGHLQFLMLLSLRLLDAQNTKADNDSQSGSETPKGASIGSDTGTRVDWDLESMTLLSFSTPPQIPSPELSEYSNTILPHHNIPEEEASFVPHITIHDIADDISYSAPPWSPGPELSEYSNTILPHHNIPEEEASVVPHTTVHDIVHDIRSFSGPPPKGLGVLYTPRRIAEPLPNTAGEQFSAYSNPFFESYTYEGFFNDPPHPQEDRGVTATNTGGADTAHPPAERKRKAEDHQATESVGLPHISQPLMTPNDPEDWSKCPCPLISA
jgi:hypothetical protein